MNLVVVRLLFLPFVVAFPAPELQANDCAPVESSLRLPARIKTTGRPPRARWGEVDRVLTQIREELEGKDCRFRFEEVFQFSRPEWVFFPVTNNLLRTAPEDSLEGLAVYNQEGELLGHFENRVTYERSGGLQLGRSYTLHYFQFKGPEGDLRSSGNRLLLDDFLVRWEDVRGRVVIASFR